MMIEFQIMINFIISSSIIIIIIIIVTKSKSYNTLCKTTRCETHFKAYVFFLLELLPIVIIQNSINIYQATNMPLDQRKILRTFVYYVAARSPLSH